MVSFLLWCPSRTHTPIVHDAIYSMGSMSGASHGPTPIHPKIIDKHTMIPPLLSVRSASYPLLFTACLLFLCLRLSTVAFAAGSSRPIPPSSGMAPKSASPTQSSPFPTTFNSAPSMPKGQLVAPSVNGPQSNATLIPPKNETKANVEDIATHEIQDEDHSSASLMQKCREQQAQQPTPTPFHPKHHILAPVLLLLVSGLGVYFSFLTTYSTASASALESSQRSSMTMKYEYLPPHHHGTRLAPHWFIPLATKLTFLGKHFGTGVILATAFIHMYPAAIAAFADACCVGWCGRPRLSQPR